MFKGDGDENGAYKRYENSELSPFPIPGRPGAYVANGSEHDAYGDTTHLPEHHVQMTERRFSKLATSGRRHLREREYRLPHRHHAVGRLQGASSRCLRRADGAGC